MESVVYAIANQKGGCGKTTLSLNLAVALARLNKKILLVDLDPQANATMALGHQSPDELPLTIANILKEVIDNQMKPERSVLIQSKEYIFHAQDIDFVPSCIELAAIENILINTISRENVLKRFINFIKNHYDIIIIDTMPSLSFVTINALTAADRVLIPVQPQFFSAKGLEMLLQTIAEVRENLNQNLSIEGALITMFDGRLRFHRQVVETVTSSYQKYFRVFDTKIPVSVRTTETQSRGISIFEYEPKGRVAESYSDFVRELMACE